MIILRFFLILSMLCITSCAYKGVIPRDFHKVEINPAINKLQLKVALLHTEKLNGIKLKNTSSHWKVDYTISPQILHALEEELKISFKEVVTVSSLEEVKKYDVLAIPHFEIEETWSNNSGGDTEYEFKLYLTFQDPATKTEIKSFVFTEKDTYYPPETAVNYSKIIICTLGLGSFLVSDNLRENVALELKNKVGGSISKVLKRSTLQIKKDKNLANYANMRKNSQVIASYSKHSIPSTQLTGVYGKCHALIIGNNKYKNFPKLITAVNDAKAVASLLEKEYDYNTYLLIDATRTDILNAMSKLKKTLSANDNLVIYYAGHGWLDKKADEGYWIPVDADKNNEVNWISNASITTMLRGMDANHVLLVADSCFSGTLTRGLSIKATSTDKNTYMKKARSVLSSGGLEPVADSGKNGHSVFTGAFLNSLHHNKKQISASDLFKNIKPSVVGNADQTPKYSDIRKSGHDGGEFQFIKKSK